jgi:hypothetical protein
MAYRVWILLLAITLINNPVAFAKQKTPKQKATLMDVYAQSVGQSKKDMQKFIDGQLTEQQTFGYVKPYVPIVNPPVVRKIWIPDHKSMDDQDVLVAGHWTYVMVEGPKWFIDTSARNDVPSEIIPAEPAKSKDAKRPL